MSLLKVALSCAALTTFGVTARKNDEESRRDDQSYYKDNKGQMHLKIDSNNEYRIM
jgi:hypothetical protein